MTLATAFLWLALPAHAAEPLPCEPESELLELPDSGLTPTFCANWNPDFVFRGSQCCGKVAWNFKRRGVRCTPERSKETFCNEMTEDQRRYFSDNSVLAKGDILKIIADELDLKTQQAYCEPHNGFLAFGRPILESSVNRIKLRRPERCVNFGTDRMVGFLEWVGRKYAERYSAPENSDLKLLIGDVSAPRGGCLYGKGGKRGHGSHMTGQDADIGFISERKPYREVKSFHRNFEPEPNWWLLKQAFSNPFACVKVVFLDRKHINTLARFAKDDPEWVRLRPHIRHIKRHQDHFHVRVGDQAGVPGCGSTSVLANDTSSMAE